MAHEQQRALVFQQRGVERFDGFHVHVVGRFVISSTLFLCSISLPNNMRPFSPPDSTFTRFLASSPESAGGQRGTHSLVVIVWAVQ